MNIFRLAGDMTHLLSIMVLLLKIHATRSCRGISPSRRLGPPQCSIAIYLKYNCCALCCQMSGKHRCCRESFLSGLVGRLH